MSISNLMSMFRLNSTSPTNTSAAAPNPSQVANPGQPFPGTQASPVTANNGVVPSLPDNQNVSPLAAHANTWENVSTPEPDKSMFSDLDPQKVLESAQKVNHTPKFSQEDMQAIAAGGEQAVNVFSRAMNQTAQLALANSTVATTKIVEQALAAQAAKFQDTIIPQIVRKLSINENLRTEDPRFNDPAVKPVIDALSSSYQQKFPNATAAEIRTQVSNYMADMAKAFSPAPAVTEAQKNANINWEKWSQS